MIQHNILNVKLANSQLNKLESGIKNDTGLTSNLSPNVVGNSNIKTYFWYRLLLTNAQVLMIHRAFVNGLSVKIKLPKTQPSKMVLLGESIFGYLPWVL